MPLETQTYRVFPQRPQNQTPLAGPSPPLAGEEREARQRHRDPRARALGGTSLGGAKLARNLRARRGRVRRDHCWCRLPGTLPTHTPDTHGVWGHQGSLWKRGELSGFHSLRPPIPAALSYKAPRVLNCTSYSRRGGKPGAGLPPRTSYPQPRGHLPPPRCRLLPPLGSKLLGRLPKEVQGQGWGMSRLQDEA